MTGMYLMYVEPVSSPLLLAITKNYESIIFSERGKKTFDITRPVKTSLKIAVKCHGYGDQ